MGYGLIQTGTHAKPRASLAHRVAWQLYVGPIPPGAEVMHKCDNPACVRFPVRGRGCLRLGTHADNMADMYAKGRSGPVRHPERMPRGEAHGMAVLTSRKVRRIRARLANGESVRALARAYAVDRGTITGIRDGRTWRHV